MSTRRPKPTDPARYHLYADDEFRPRRKALTLRQELLELAQREARQASTLLALPEEPYHYSCVIGAVICERARELRAMLRAHKEER